VPTVADLRSRRMEVLEAALRERLTGGDYDDVRVVVESLSTEYDIVQIAAAAVKMTLEATTGAQEEKDIPQVPARPPREARAPGSRETAPRPGGPPRQPRGEGGEMTRLFIGAGRAAGVRPGDLVGAIAGETGYESRIIGSIEVADRFSIVEVPRELEKDIITALRATTIRGRKVTVNRDRGTRRPEGRG
jgi:ATP-dependent RNA helicase DeaD